MLRLELVLVAQAGGVAAADLALDAGGRDGGVGGPGGGSLLERGEGFSGLDQTLGSEK